MKAFLNNNKVQEKYITRLEQHYKLDEIIKGQYWEGGKGCAVGCTVHSNSHNCYETELGIPEWIARLEDVLFEGMPNEKAKEFPLKLLKAIPVGFDNWQHIYHQLCVFMLEKICKDTDDEIVVNAICDIITLHKTESKDESAWSAAQLDAQSSVSATDSAARSAVLAAESAVRLATAGSVTRSASWSARSAVLAVDLVVDSVVDSVDLAVLAVWSAAYYEISEKLIKLLKESQSATKVKLSSSQLTDEKNGAASGIKNKLVSWRLT